MDQQAIINEINRVRTNPQAIIAELEARIPQFQGNLFKRPQGIDN